MYVNKMSGIVFVMALNNDAPFVHSFVRSSSGLAKHMIVCLSPSLTNASKVVDTTEQELRHCSELYSIPMTIHYAEEKDFVKYNSKNPDAYFEQLLKLVQSFPSTSLSPFQAVMFTHLECVLVHKIYTPSDLQTILEQPRQKIPLFADSFPSLVPTLTLRENISTTELKSFLETGGVIPIPRTAIHLQKCSSNELSSRRCYKDGLTSSSWETCLCIWLGGLSSDYDCGWLCVEIVRLCRKYGDTFTSTVMCQMAMDLSTITPSLLLEVIHVLTAESESRNILEAVVKALNVFQVYYDAPICARIFQRLKYFDTHLVDKLSRSPPALAESLVLPVIKQSFDRRNLCLRMDDDQQEQQTVSVQFNNYPKILSWFKTGQGCKHPDSLFIWMLSSLIAEDDCSYYIVWCINSNNLRTIEYSSPFTFLERNAVVPVCLVSTLDDDMNEDALHIQLKDDDGSGDVKRAGWVTLSRKCACVHKFYV